MKKIKNLLCIALCLLMLISLLPLCAAAQEEEKIMIGVGFVTMPYQQLYSEPSSQSQTLAVTNENDCVVVIEQINDSWYLVNHNLQEGYMYADALDIRTEVHAELGKGRINSDIVYMRTGPGTEYSIFISGYQDREFTIIGMFNGWYKVLGKKQTHSVYSTCYVRSDLMDLAEIPYQNEASENTPAYFYLGQEIGEIDYKEQDQVAMAAPGSYYVPISGGYLLAQAQNYLGVPYVFGGYSPEGFDCSGLVYYILEKTGYPVPRTAADQYNMGYAVSRDQLAAGDLVFFENTYTSGVSHVGIYAGGGKFIHAPNDGGSVCYGSLSGYWADHYCGARRIG